VVDAQPGPDAICDPLPRTPAPPDSQLEAGGPNAGRTGDVLADVLTPSPLTGDIVIDDVLINDVLTDGAARPVVPRRQPLTAELVANDIRDRILHGDLGDGSQLPMQDEIMRQYEVSRAAVREALHVLEAEGLVTVRRGARGGALVHAPTTRSTAYTFAMLLESRGATLRDIGEALANIEPMCAIHAAARPDRLQTVIPTLERAHAAMADTLQDGPSAVAASRRWHRSLLAAGGTVMLTVVGILEVLWTGHEARWTLEADEEGEFPEMALREKALREHREIMDAIADGAVAEVSSLTHDHLRNAQRIPPDAKWDVPIDAMAVRRQLHPTPRTAPGRGAGSNRRP